MNTKTDEIDKLVSKYRQETAFPDLAKEKKEQEPSWLDEILTWLGDLTRELLPENLGPSSLSLPDWLSEGVFWFIGLTALLAIAAIGLSLLLKTRDSRLAQNGQTDEKVQDLKRLYDANPDDLNAWARWYWHHYLHSKRQPLHLTPREYYATGNLMTKRNLHEMLDRLMYGPLVFASTPDGQKLKRTIEKNFEIKL